MLLWPIAQKTLDPMRIKGKIFFTAQFSYSMCGVKIENQTLLKKFSPLEYFGQMFADFLAPLKPNMPKWHTSFYKK